MSGIDDAPMDLVAALRRLYPELHPTEVSYTPDASARFTSVEVSLNAERARQLARALRDEGWQFAEAHDSVLLVWDPWRCCRRG